MSLHPDIWQARYVSQLRASNLGSILQRECPDGAERQFLAKAQEAFALWKRLGPELAAIMDGDTPTVKSLELINKY